MMATLDGPGLDAGQLADLDGADRFALLAEIDDLRAALLAASGAADLASAARLTYFTDGYAAGFESGRQVGYGQAVTDWKVTASDTCWNRPAHVELDRRRYPPDGRLSWLMPRLGDLWADWSAWCDAEGGE